MVKKKEFRTFEDLECWQACRALRRFSAKILKEQINKLSNQQNNGETKTRSYA